ncbi:hypothetical protein [Sulfuricurvum sp.]|uniref:hypothetical protein n=1 Tax=Sulfuricurvum sp. TaxID=2025608 RepID=UPI002D3CA796|nr:hypothetical protein [Sulfuricurvum sp.]HZF70922.1 hypothetical protein [Sulfuricurvum sp.]
MIGFIKEYRFLILLVLSVGCIYLWYDPGYCYKEGKKYTDADFKDGPDNYNIVSELARNYGFVRTVEHVREDGGIETDYNQDDMKKLEVEVDEFYKKFPKLKGGSVNGKGYTYDPDWDYADKFAHYYFSLKDIQKVNDYLKKKRTHPPEKIVVGIYYGASYSKCGKYTGDSRVGYEDSDIYEGDPLDLRFNPYKKQKTNK